MSGARVLARAVAGLILAAFAADLLTFLWAVHVVGLAGESNPLARALGASSLWFVIAGKATAALIVVNAVGRMPHLRWLAIGLAVGVPLVGAISNVRAVL